MGRGHAARAPALILVFSLLAPLSAEADYRFDEGVYLGSAELLPDWAATLERVAGEQQEIDACLAKQSLCDRYLRGVHALMARARALDRDRQLRLINRYVNRRHYRGDRTSEGPSALSSTETVRLPSRWSTLLEFMRRGGDCEDYATSKYQLLRALDVPAEDLRVVVVFDRETREHHAVLAVRRDDDSAWLLDSDDRIHRGQPFGYKFVYALNETSIWDHELEPQAWFERISSLNLETSS